jgi:hypothetical protein
MAHDKSYVSFFGQTMKKCAINSNFRFTAWEIPVPVEAVVLTAD